MRNSWRRGGVLFIVSVAGVIGAAYAYTIDTSFTSGCHEKITSEAFRAARVALAIAPTPPVTENERALIDDLQFTPDGDMRDLAGATLLVSVRDNDLKGNDSQDLSVLAAVHGDPSNQPEHCLRSPDQKEPGGSQVALADCLAFIRGRVLEALDALDAAGRPDLANRTPLSLHLSLRGHVDAPLPTYYVRIGQALHALQDTFTHAYRTADGAKITVILNWLGEVDGTLDESVDGPAHATALDVCDDPDDVRKTRRLLATEASTAVLRATLDPSKTRAEKVVAVDGILVTYASYQPGCTFDNGWCNAPERQYKDSGKNVLGCSAAGTGQDGGAMASWGFIVLFLFAVASRARRGRLGGTIASALIIAGAFTLGTGNARAQSDASKPAAAAPVAPTATSTTTTTPAKAATDTAPATAATITTTSTTTGPATPDTHAAPPPVIVAVKEPGPTDPSQMAWGAYLGTSGSFDKPGLAMQLGARLKLSRHWTVGLDGELNPWISANGYKVRRGVNNYYGTVILRFPLAYERFNLRTTVNLGVSQLMMNLYGAPKGTLGLYAGVSPLGLEWKLSRMFLVIINPLNIALPVPQLKGVPLDYPQYRVSIGLGVMAG